MIIREYSSLQVMIISVVFAFVLCVPVSLLAGTESSGSLHQIKDLVWAVVEGKQNSLYFSTKHDGNWSKPVKVTQGNAVNLHPCIHSGPDGKKWLVWTAVEEGKSDIRYAVATDGMWSEMQTLPSDLSSNIAPTVIVDNFNVPWVVWAGNDGVSMDEIYYSRFKDSKWQRPELVNGANEVPDVLPVILMNEKGNYQVTWDGYRNGIYIKLWSLWTENGWGPEMMSLERENSYVEEQVDYPDFVEDTRQAFLRVYHE